MDKTERVELTVLCLLYRENKILLQNRRKKDWQGYALPGGHVEKGEAFTNAVIREMKEETGLDVIEPVLCGVKQFPIEDGRYIVFLFKSNQFKGELVSSDEGEMEWVDRDRLSEIQLVDDFEELLKVMEDEKLHEFQYIVDGDEWQVVLK